MNKSKQMEEAKTIARIRQLIKHHGTSETARIVGRTPANVSQIKHGHRHNQNKPLTINSLELKRVGNNFKCRCCNEHTQLVTKSMLCVECELFELHKQSLVEIN